MVVVVIMIVIVVVIVMVVVVVVVIVIVVVVTGLKHDVAFVALETHVEWLVCRGDVRGIIVARAPFELLRFVELHVSTCVVNVAF